VLDKALDAGVAVIGQIVAPRADGALFHFFKERGRSFW
jgi:hypothetical protein